MWGSLRGGFCPWPLTAKGRPPPRPNSSARRPQPAATLELAWGLRLEPGTSPHPRSPSRVLSEPPGSCQDRGFMIRSLTFSFTLTGPGSWVLPTPPLCRQMRKTEASGGTHGSLSPPEYVGQTGPGSSPYPPASLPTVDASVVTTLQEKHPPSHCRGPGSVGLSLPAPSSVGRLN